MRRTLPKRDIDDGLALLDDDVEAELTKEKEEGWERDEAENEDEEGGDANEAQGPHAVEKVHIRHGYFFISRMMCEARE